MTLVALWLGCIGLAEFARWTPRRSGRRSATAWVVGCLPLALLVSTDAQGTAPVLALALAVALALWLWTSDMAFGSSGRVGAPLMLLALVILAGLASSGGAPSIQGPIRAWYNGLDLDGLAGVSFDSALLSAACSLFLCSAANVVVRLVLQGAGTLRLADEPGFKGGRLLGVLERLFIFGLALAGETAAASVIVAAKGLLRFPEIQARKGSPGNTERIDSLTEYFLLGSMTSWALALAAAALAAL